MQYIKDRHQSLLIQHAQKEHASKIAPLIYDAIGTIAHHLTNENELPKVLKELTALVEDTQNRHSYQNTYVAMEENNIVGVAVLYDGQKGRQLDTLLSKKLCYTIEFEAHDDEYYIDTLCVDASKRGQGVGTQLLYFAEQQAKDLGYTKLSLNVELEKLEARKLYERIGFIVTERWMINGEPFHHMVKLI
ncbi:MAG: GNAT family N-acetyltransferase [Lysinibacillus sp.]